MNSETAITVAWTSGLFALSGVVIGGIIGGIVQLSLALRLSRREDNRESRAAVMGYRRAMRVYLVLIKSLATTPSNDGTELSKRFLDVVEAGHVAASVPQKRLRRQARKVVDAFEEFAHEHRGITSGRKADWPAHAALEKELDQLTDMLG
jgi:hypothetical protein